MLQKCHVPPSSTSVCVCVCVCVCRWVGVSSGVCRRTCPFQRVSYRLYIMVHLRFLSSTPWTLGLERARKVALSRPHDLSICEKWFTDREGHQRLHCRVQQDWYEILCTLDTSRECGRGLVAPASLYLAGATKLYCLLGGGNHRRLWHRSVCLRLLCPCTVLPLTYTFTQQ